MTIASRQVDLFETFTALAESNAWIVEYENARVPDADIWIRCALRITSTVPATTGAPGANLIRSSGLLDFRINVPPGSGTLVGKQMQQEIADAYQSAAEKPHVRIYPAICRDIGRFMTWYQLQAEIPFQSDEIG